MENKKDCSKCVWHIRDGRCCNYMCRNQSEYEELPVREKPENDQITKKLRDLYVAYKVTGNMKPGQILADAADAIEDLESKLSDLMDKYIKLAARTEWIPVTERLPKEDGMYLVHGKWSASGRKVTDTCEFFVHDGYFRASWNFDVTHWMPIPQTPKEES